MNKNNSLTWVLMICTYNRSDILYRCVELALKQTRPPNKIVIVDASDNWKTSKSRISGLIQQCLPLLPLVYEEAKVRSTTHQRNQAYKHVNQDIIFAIDDDSLMDQHCADEIMKIYERDTENLIAGVGASDITTPPDVEPYVTSKEKFSSNNPAKGKAYKFLKSVLENRLSAEKHFVPYKPFDSLKPKSEELSHERFLAVKVMNGYRSTFRKLYSDKVSWCETLQYYALHEDLDYSYRLSRHGKIVLAENAFLCHCQASGGRLPRETVNKLRVLNLIALHKNFSQHLLMSFFSLSFSYIKFSILYLMIDPLRGRYSFPTTRAYIYGIFQIPLLLSIRGRNFKDAFTLKVQSLVDKRNTRQ